VPDPEERALRRFSRDTGFHLSDVESVKFAFKLADTDGNRTIDKLEFRVCVARLHGLSVSDISDTKMRKLFSEVVRYVVSALLEQPQNSSPPGQGALLEGCWDLEFTFEAACCGDRPLRADCFSHEDAVSMGLTEETCCRTFPEEINEDNFWKIMRVLDFHASPESCIGAADRIIAVLKAIPELASEAEDLQQFWSARPLAEVGRTAGDCLDPVYFLHHQLELLELVLSMGVKGSLLDKSFEHFSKAADGLDAALMRRSVQSFGRERRRAAVEGAAVEGAEREARISEREPVEIAMVASVGKPAYGKKAVATIRSALFFARLAPLRFHLLVDEEGEQSMKRSMSSIEPWLLKRGTYVFRRVDQDQDLWQLLRSLVPEDCLNHRAHYGSPGWLRMFPAQVFVAPGDPEVVIWVDAGDFIFLDDPGKLLQHARVLEAAQVVGAPKGHPLPFQVFHLSRMRESSDWHAALVQVIQEGYAAHGSQFCDLGEGGAMSDMAGKHPYLWGFFASSWAYEPWQSRQVGLGVKNHWADRAVRDGRLPQVWHMRSHPGILDFTSMHVSCASLAVGFWFKLLGNSYLPASDFKSALANAIVGYKGWAANVTFKDWAGQYLTCGERIHGVHLVLPFHSVPWAHRLLNFWANSDVWNSDWENGRDLRVAMGRS
ncbi:unnamed protein product, partial [Polarella glacialis]